MYSVQDTAMRWVPPFGHFRIKAFSQLPETFRSVTRPSSPLTAKASTRCPYYTWLLLSHITNRTKQYNRIARRMWTILTYINSDSLFNKPKPIKRDLCQKNIFTCLTAETLAFQVFFSCSLQFVSVCVPWRECRYMGEKPSRQRLFSTFFTFFSDPRKIKDIGGFSRLLFSIWNVFFCRRHVNHLHFAYYFSFPHSNSSTTTMKNPTFPPTFAAAKSNYRAVAP